jgi:hypothetical protein
MFWFLHPYEFSLNNYHAPNTIIYPQGTEIPCMLDRSSEFMCDEVHRECLPSWLLKCISEILGLTAM